MKKTFKEYHQFTEAEFKVLWQDCLFVFDTNALLNMYRYSRKTVDAYLEVLTELKSKKQLWIPYQVGFEFHENRIGVISEHEKSYDEILSILEKAKNEINNKYRDHPFLDLPKIQEGINKGLSGVEVIIKETKNEHPKWLEKDDVLEKISTLFEGNVGRNFDEKRLDEIKREGKERYENKIPPGFRDSKKSEEKKYGDLILWLQIIEKAKESKKSVILISGDVKNDWWLIEDGKRIMPLPQLKKEILDKADVDFHIYTADTFLELSKADKQQVYKDAIREVRKIREMEEKRITSLERMKMMELEEKDECMPMLGLLQTLLVNIRELNISQKSNEEIDRLLHGTENLMNRYVHGEDDRTSLHGLHGYVKETLFTLEEIIHAEKIDPESYVKINEWLHRLRRMNHRLNKHL
jgi:hypothetical protein